MITPDRVGFDSPWFGELPTHWSLSTLKNLVERYYSGGTPESGGDRYWTSRGDGIPFEMIGDMSRGGNIESTARAVTEEGRDSKRLEVLPPGTILYSMYASLGKAATLAVPAVVNQAIMGIGLKSIADQRWFLYWLGFIEPQVPVLASSSTQANLNAAKVRNLEIALPPLEEQQAIARFLDRKSRRIARFIHARQRMIALLTEQKQAIIHQAVTRGLDPHVPLKPSGIHWLGDIPVHWAVLRVSALFAERNVLSQPELPILEVSLRTGVRIRDLEAGRKQMMSDKDKYKVARAGDYVFNMMRFWQGAGGEALVDGLVSPAYVVARPLKRELSGFFDHVFKTPEYLREIEFESRGIVPDRNRLYWDRFKLIPCPVPPDHELPLIEAAIVRVEHEFQGRIDHIRKQMTLLVEYRTRLIADVVTGRLDIRDHPDAAEGAPDDPDVKESLDGILDGDGPVVGIEDDEPVGEAAR